MASKKPLPGSTTPKKLIDGSLIFITLVAVVAGIAVYVTHGAGAFWNVVARETLFTGALVPKIVAGVIMASALPFLVSKERIQALVGPESGMRGLIIATLAGAIVPGGPSVTYPLTVSLLAAGADLGAGIALVSGWVLLGLNRTLIWEFSFLPADFVLLRVALSLPVPILLGWATRKLYKGRDV